MQGVASFASPGSSPTQATQCTAVPVKIDARELGERLAADAWASADRLLVCLCLRAWRLQRHGCVPVKSPTPPVQFQGAKALRPGRHWSSTAFTPPRRVEEKPLRAFDLVMQGQKEAPPRQANVESRLHDYFRGWKDEAHASVLVRRKMEEMQLKERMHHKSSPEASPKSQGKTASPSRKVNVDLTELDPFSLSPKASPNTSPEAQQEQPLKATQQRLADAEQALAESLWLSQKGQRISKVEVKVERHLRTQELLHLRLTWQAWEDLVKEKKPQANLPVDLQALEEREANGLVLEVGEARQGLQPAQSRRGNTVRQRGYASWESLVLAGERAKAPDGKADIDSEVPRGHGLQGWIRERTDLHMKIQLLRDQLDQERQEAIQSANNSQLALTALQEELQMEKEKLRTQGILQRAYLQSEISSQDAEREKAERALEAVRKRSLAKMINPRILTKVFRAWARIFRQTLQAVSMLKQLPSVDSPRRLRFLIEDAERESFSVQFDDWLDDDDDPRSEQEQIHDTRGLLKDQAKAAISGMNKVMERADAMWAAVRLRISLFRGFSLTRCQAMEDHGLVFVTFAGWARLLQRRRVTRLAVARSAKVSEPFELAEYFYLWQAMQLQSAETDKVLSRIMRGSLALSSAGCGFSGPDLVKLTFHFWRLHSGFAYRTRSIMSSYVPIQDSSWFSLVFKMWFACVHASIKERAATTESLRAEMAKDVSPESPANAPQPHPAPDSPGARSSIRGSIRGSRLLPEIFISERSDATMEEETAEQKELRLVTEAAEKAGSSLPIVRVSANTYKIGEKTVQVQLRNDQVLVKQGAAFVPMAKFVSTGASGTGSATPPASVGTPRGGSSGAATPPGARTPRSSIIPPDRAAKAPPSPRSKTSSPTPSSLSLPKGASKATSKATSKAPSASPKAKAPSAPTSPASPRDPKAKAKALSALSVPPKAQSKQAPASPRSALAKALAPKAAKPSGPASLLTAMAKAR